MFEVFMIIWKAKNHTPSSKKEAIFFTIGAVCFFFSNLSLLVTDILNTLSKRRPVWYSVEDAPDFFPITIIVTSISIIGMYTGIIHCCMQWHKLGPHGPSKPVSTEDESSQMLIVASDQR
ncbi:uncharacterized protein N7500_002919 [Penicillium coprophilum]|uniref:uncharacterized protein n=1 Tax=Penicillium coprophilum TaxID=36646 RepID=UPI0023974974|nr:uncharacterized protein N7500_002919 [Penicillium coprophilum]KAJ5170136.1 hypothetical protein N7500_002919 [Penicillium coprophilum]